jgi:hypothetical protein
MLWIPIMITLLTIGNIWLAYAYLREPVFFYTLTIGIVLALLLFVYAALAYISYFRRIHHAPRIDIDLTALLRELDSGNMAFIRFFDQTILNQWIIIGLIIFSGYTMFATGWSQANLISI